MSRAFAVSLVSKCWTTVFGNSCYIENSFIDCWYDSTVSWNYQLQASGLIYRDAGCQKRAIRWVKKVLLYSHACNFIKCWPIFQFFRAFFRNFHLEPKLWRHKWRNFRFCKSCRAMRFPPLDRSEDFMGRGGLSFSLSLTVSELWRHQLRHNDVISRFAKVVVERCRLHPRPWTM